MKVAVVYNRESKKVINVFGTPNLEKYGRKSIDRIVRCLREDKHQVQAFEGDKDLIANLEEFMPRVIQGERPGMVFNLAYGIQGQARYTHVPGILEMVGLPYVGSGPLAHSLALDKVVAKMIFIQHGLPTPEFAVLDNPDFPDPELPYPLIVKPRNEAVSMGIRIVHDEGELREAAGVIFDRFQQSVLVERFIDGREINVGILGNSPPIALPPAELTFGEGPKIYTIEDKKRQSGREIGIVCPAQLDDDIALRAQELSVRAFRSLQCADCARIDMRMDDQGNLYILEINSLPSLGEHGSYVQGAAAIGLDFSGLVNRLVDEASARYFGTPSPPGPEVKGGTEQSFAWLTSQRDRIEQRVAEWTARRSRTLDPMGLRAAFRELDKVMGELGLERMADLSADPQVSVWQTQAGLENGTLLVANVDVPLALDAGPHAFRRDPEWLYGEGIASSRASLVMLEFALRALRKVKRLRHTPLGVLFHADEGLDCTYSQGPIKAAAARAREVLVLRPGAADNAVVTGRRGMRHYDLVVESRHSRKLGQAARRPEVLRWTWDRLEACCGLTDRRRRIAVAVGDMRSSSYRMLLPHSVRVDLVIGSPDDATADAVEARIREVLGPSKDGYRWHLELASNRPAMPDRKKNPLRERLRSVAQRWEIPLTETTSLLPSAAGLVPPDVPVVCGMGPASVETHTTQEAVQRISLVQRILLLSQLLLADAEGQEGRR